MRKAYEKRVVCMRSCWSTLSRKTKKGAISYRNIDCITDGARACSSCFMYLVGASELFACMW